MATESAQELPPLEVRAEIESVVSKAKAGDQSVLPRLQELLTQYPIIWRRSGDLASQAEAKWINLFCGQNLLLQESTLCFVQSQRAELTRPGASAVEKLLIDQVIVCWLQAQYFSALEVNAHNAKEGPKMIQLRAKRNEQAQKMSQSAMAALLSLQKLKPNLNGAASRSGAEESPVMTEPKTASDRPRGGAAADYFEELHNRVEPYFGALGKGAGDIGRSTVSQS